jgi:hypothetical protein
MTVEELQARLNRARAAMGYGRFALTLSQGDRKEAYLTFWFLPDQYAIAEECRTVESGTLDDCMDALDRYVAVNRLRDEVPAYSVAAE